MLVRRARLHQLCVALPDPCDEHADDVTDGASDDDLFWDQPHTNP
jgi:hypothetical protein